MRTTTRRSSDSCPALPCVTVKTLADERDLRAWDAMVKLMPLLSAEERQTLGDSIARDGVRVPVDGRIVDGLNVEDEV